MFFTIPYFLERMIEQPVSVLSVLSISAIITTISLFFCGIPICLEIWRRKSTEEITGFPFLMGFLGGTFWLRYGLLKLDLTMITVNVVGVSLMFLYLMFYLFYTRSKTFILFELIVVFAVISAMLVLVEIYGLAMIDALGFVCMTFNILNFGAPLAGVTIVFKKKCCETLPLPLCTANLLVSSQWCIYGMLVHDIYIIIPNGAGVLLAFLQISLFLIFPRMPGGSAPFRRFFPCLKELEPNEKPELPSENVHVRNGCWSRQRVMDRTAIPPSRTACIAFLRSSAFNQGGYYGYNYGGGYGGSVTSRTTADSCADTATTQVNLSRVSSMSHPELWGDLYPYNTYNHTNNSLLNNHNSILVQSSIAVMPTTPSQQQALVNPADKDEFEFDRIREIDELDRQWSERELKRAKSAPDLGVE